MTMAPRMRLFVLAAHVTSSVGLLGAVACFLALALVGVSSRDVPLVRAAYVAMNFTAEFVIVPLMFASLLVGIVESLGTTWGLFRHYWVLAKLLLTILATVVLLFQMDAIGFLAAEATRTTLSSADLPVQFRLVVHAAGGLLVLVLLTVLSVYKPRGLTRFGASRRRGERALSKA